MYNTLFSTRSSVTVMGFVLAAALLAHAQGGGPQSMQGKTAEQVYKNIKVLNGTPADELTTAMHLLEVHSALIVNFVTKILTGPPTRSSRSRSRAR